MRYLKFLLTLFLLSFSVFVFAEVFTVTNNADAGAGTLREALTKAAANGSADKDYIYFNLSDLSEAGRTIIITTALPFVSSNLVIDGTTQTGSKLGRSNAKITLQPVSSISPFNALVLVDVVGFEIYGMYIRDFRGSVINDPSQGGYTNASALYIETSDNIQIGAPGKGNVFVNNGYIESTTYVSIKTKGLPAYGVNNLKVYNNIFGLEPDGKTVRGSVGFGIDLSYCKGVIEIGGENIERRNIFGYLTDDIMGFYTGRDRLFTSTFLIQNNYIGYDIDGLPMRLPDFNTSYIYGIFFNISRWIYYYETISYPYTFQILNNRIQYPYTINVTRLSGDIVMQGNAIINEPYSTRPNYIGGIGLSSDNNIIIGGEQPGEANAFYGSEVDLFSRKSILIQRNSIYCVNSNRGVWYPAVAYLDPPLPLPEVNIDKVTANSVSGTATPLSKVELFWDDDCQQCEPLTYITTITADATGKWTYNGAIQKGVIASATLNGFTSVFTTQATANGSKITHYSCGGNGFVTGMTFKNTGGYKWTDQGGKIIGTSTDIKDLAPGKYTFTALNGTCSTDYTFTIFDATPKINDSYKRIQQPSCSSKGSITGLYLDNNDVLQEANSKGDYNVYSYKWLDASDNVKSTNIDLNKVEAGTYRLLVTYKNICTTTYGPITLKNTTGPNIDETTAKKTSTPCGQSQGSITNLNITGTGNLKYSWKNAQNQEVSTSKDLTNQLAGRYILQVTDETTCGPVYSSAFEITEINGVTIDDTQKQVTVATCTDNNGSITGIKAIGATSYQWINTTGKVVSTTLDLTAAAPDNYYLLASNSASCSKQSPTYTITRQANLINIGGTGKILKDASCGLNNGRIEVLLQNPVVLPKYYRWQNRNNQTVGSNSLILNDIDAGTYSLYGTDDNGCEKLIDSYAINRIPELQIVSGSAQITNDQCTQKTGSIKGVKIAGGVLPYTYKWVNAAGQQLSTIADLLNMQGGTFQLQVKDATDCGTVIQTFALTDQSVVVAAPSANNLQLCGPGKSFLTVNNPVSGSAYRLYNTLAGVTPADEQQTGKFLISVKSNSKFYISQVIGSCESIRAEVNVSVGISAVNIANTFSPNGDGINDLWILKGIENYPFALVQLFNRYGQKVFESKGYANAFDGNINDKRLPEGTYYYIINLSSACNLISGNLTLIR